MKIATLAAVVVGTGLVAPAHAGEPATFAITPNTLVTGRIAIDGVPAARASFTVFAWPSESVLENAADGWVIPTQEEGTATTDASGRFALNVDPASISSRHKSSDGNVDFEVLVYHQGRQMSWNFSSTIVGARWSNPRVDADPDERASRGLATTDLEIDLGSESYVVEEGDDPTEWLDLSGERLGGAGRSAARVEVEALGARIPCHWAAQPNYQRNRKERFAETFGVQNAKPYLVQTTGTDHTLGIALKLPSKPSWSHDGSITVSFAAGAETGPGYSTAWHNRVNYRQYRALCGDGYRYQWRPHSYYALQTDPTPIGTPSLNVGCSPNLSSGTFWKSQAKNVTYSTGVDLTVLNVTARSGWDSSTKIKFVVGRSNVSRLCGNNIDGWLKSSRVRSR